MFVQPSAATVPAHITACLNRATDRAAKVLRYDHGTAAPRRLLRPHGEAAIVDPVDHHPTDPQVLEFLETVLCDIMVEVGLHARSVA